MKKLSVFILGMCTAILFSSCSSSTSPGTTTTAPKMNFKKGLHAQYNIFAVDTADKNGNNADLIVGDPTPVSEITVDTGLTYRGKSHVALVVTYDKNSTPKDSNYFYQDANGDLY